MQGQLPSPLRQAGSELEGINTDWKIDLSQDKKRKTQGMERGPCQKVKKKKWISSRSGIVMPQLKWNDKNRIIINLHTENN